MPRFAANLSMMFNEVPFAERFAAAAAAGFEAVEYLFPYELAPDAVAAVLARHGLTQALFNMPPGDWAAGDRGLAALPDRRQEFRRGVATALDYAAATSCRTLHMMAGNASAADPVARAAFLDALAFAADAAAPRGVTVVIEPINGRDMPGYFLADFDLAIDLIGAAGRDNVRLQYDVYHRQIIHGDVTRSLEALMPLVGHVQIASVPFRHEPGTGELDDGFVFDQLDRLGYAGFVGCEYRPKAGTVEGLGWMKRLG